ncbi:hypothetical protein GOP47_0029061 [Adiantum capillus-veneris]|nr:hypothetical protein GOP47_0029061 [Adiantum capillus-veneris]
MGRNKASRQRAEPTKQATTPSTLKKRKSDQLASPDNGSLVAELPNNPAENDKEVVEDDEASFSQSYFRAREASSEGLKSSSKKISDLDIVEENELRSAILRVPSKHEKEQATLFDSYKALYPKWHFQLSCGFGLLMYGFGSKKALLENFASSALVDGAAIVVNGYLPTVNIKTVVFTIADALWEQRKASLKSAKLAGDRPLVTQSVDELIVSLNDKEENNFVYVIVNNIDGPGLRDADTQLVLANLAASSNVRLVASMDHINTPLLWDKRMSTTKFNWCWHNTPTYAPYTVETMNLPLILVSSGSAKSARSALLVLQSLTPNAQSVFRTLADYQLSHSEELGLSVHKLYMHCRERFLVSSELTLRSHLTEFKDHELVKSRRGLDGQDCLFIPLPSDMITKLLDQIGG